ncbi:MAG: hypothetical protein AB7V32_04065 [Candidatus Berkiella sp.]
MRLLTNSESHHVGAAIHDSDVGMYMLIASLPPEQRDVAIKQLLTANVTVASGVLGGYASGYTLSFCTQSVLAIGSFSVMGGVGCAVLAFYGAQYLLKP